MQNNLLAKSSNVYAARTDVDALLSAAHSQVEKRFLDGGTVLMSIMEVLNRLIGSLDFLTRALDDKTTAETTGGILKTVGELARLPELESQRRTSLQTLAAASGQMHSHVEDMQETMRYLRTFAITVKITGAGLAEFAGFAEEILDRIRSGSDEVNKFATELRDLDKQLLRARDFTATIVTEYAGTVPVIVDELTRDASKIGEHHKSLAMMAKDVSVLARGIQNKIATVLSALQIGDITRQRIEHVQSSFLHLEEMMQSGTTLSSDAHERLRNVVYHLAAAQMTEMVVDFQRESRNVVRNMSSFVDDTRQILQLRDAMMKEKDGGGSNFLQMLEKSVGAACALVARVKDASRQADEVAGSTTGKAQALLADIAIIRAIKTDIHYMALNTNLRCSRLGEEGRSINVVTAELRIYAGKLEVSAETVVEQLQVLEQAAQVLAANGNSASDTIDQPLTAALATIRDAGMRMEENLAELAREGQEVYNQVSMSIKTLDFESELGDVLTQCASEFAALAGSEIADISDLEDIAAELGGRIYRTYTMMQERSIHQEFLPAQATGAAQVVELVQASAPASDEELFDDALF